MLWKLSDEVGPLGQFEIGEIEAWGHRATDQCVRIWLFQTRAEPVVRRHYPLELFAGFGVLAQFDRAVISMQVDAVNEQGASGIKMPDLIGCQAVQSGKVISRKQEIDRRGGAASTCKGGRQSGSVEYDWSSISLPEEATFGMRLQVQVVDPILHAGHALD